MMEFPHLSDTKFPLLDNVNVYKYQNNFDYARWNGKVAFKLLNVLWNSNYADVPYFNSVEERDAWFDAQEGYVGTLESLFNNTPENKVKIPIPYNDAYNYNYLVVNMPIQTSVNDKINYEDSNIRIARWFYFIEDLKQFAPSTTELEISLDYWTTFIHSVEIPYLMLERGHAPMTKVSVEQFLSNPVVNNEYLLADDFNYGDDTIIQTSNYYPFGNGEKYVLFCAPYAKDDFSKFGASKYSGNSTPPSYANENARWGHQIIVNDYNWKYGDADYSNADIPVSNQIQSGILNGCECYAIAGANAKAFFNKCAEECVNFIHGIRAMFILDGNLFNRADSFTFKGYTLYIADKKFNTTNITLAKSQFGFDSKYANIAKLYTSPYSMLEITDDDGNTFSAKVENCGHLQMHNEVALVYPFLNYNVFFSGINGDGTMNYTWKLVQGDNRNETMWASDFSKYMMNWKVPTYSIYVSAENEYAANHFFDMQTKRAGAIKDYKNSVRYANTSYENMADTMQTNTDNVAATGTANITNRGTQNQANTDVTDENNDAREDLQTYNNILDTHLMDIANAQNRDNITIDNRMILVKTSLANENATIGFAANAVTAIAAGGLALGVGGAVMGAAMSLPAGVSTAVGVVNNQTEADAMYNANNAKWQISKDANLDTLGYNNDYRRDVRTRLNTQDTNNNVTNNTAALTQVTQTATTNNANATRTQTTETNNADYTRDAALAAEKANLVQKQLEAENYYKNARLHAPVTYGDYSGDVSQDAYRRRGVRFNIRTQSKSAIAQAGDAMLRFGYALHRVWDMSQGFHYGKQFTFWKAEDIWINDGSGVANAATDVIGKILLKGVTVWKDPTKIGSVGIYDNL